MSRASRRLVLGLRLAVLAAGTLAVAIVGGSCSSTPTVLPSRNFDRPTDVVFACVGQFTDQNTGKLVFSGRPIDWCQPFGLPVPAVGDKYHTFAFIPNSNSGELSVVDVDHGKLIDLDPSVSGYSRLPVGVLPEQISASDDGCRLVTANRGSCDLTVVNPALLMAPTIKPGTTIAPGTDVSAANISVTIPPTTSTGRLLAAPQEARFLPQDTVAMLSDGANLCIGDMTLGAPQPASTSPLTAPWRVLVTFPTCDLIATVELPSGVIIDSAYVRKVSDTSVTLVPAGTNPQCQADCGTVDREPVDGGGGVADADTDASADAGGSAPIIPPPGSYLGPSAIEIAPPESPDWRIHAFVSLANFPAIVPLDLSTDGLISAPATGASIALNEGAVGSNRVRLSVNPYVPASVITMSDDPTMNGKRSSKTLGKFESGAHDDRRYLYVIARDGSLRVIQVKTQPENECETNTDPQNPPPGYDPQAACTPVTPDSPTHRRPFAVGPGVRFPSIPIDVATANTRFDNPVPVTVGGTSPATAGTVREFNLSGTFSWIATSSGSVYLMNIDPVPRSIWYIPVAAPPLITLGTVTNTSTCDDGSTPCEPEPLPPVNTLRNANFQTFNRGLSAGTGPPRVDLPPPNPPTGPRIATLWTQGTANNATAVTGGTNNPTYTYFPDPAAVSPQTWDVSWQGSLSGGPRFTGNVVLEVSQLQDVGFSFCQVGSQLGDLVTFTGCTTDNDCGVGGACIHGSGATEAAGGLAVGGICVDPTAKDELSTTCVNELSTVRRYTITQLSDHVVTLEPHLDELAFSNLHACSASRRRTTMVADAGAGIVDGGSADGGAGGPADCSDPNDSTTSQFRCTDLTSAGLAGVSGVRCVQSCTEPLQTAGCRAGRICVPYGGFGDCSHGNCFCADAPPFDPKHRPCGYDQLTPYQVNAGRALMVSGSVTALPTARQVVGDQCGPPVSKNPRAVSRISMDAGPMMTCADPNGTFAALVAADTRCNSTSVLSDPTHAGCVKLFEALQTMPSPNPCLFTTGPNETDPAGNDTIEHVNALFRNTEVAFIITNLEWAPAIPQDIKFQVDGGFRPQTVFLPPTVEVSMPGRIVVGPLQVTTAFVVPETPYLFVVDQRALGRTQAGGPTRGQLLRIHPFGSPDPNGAYEPWFEDFTHSNNQYPIR
jgi:hypothetical protein